MPKDIPVSNGSFLLNFDFDYCLRDIFFPFIGQENHSKGHASRFGVWVDGNFSWMGPEWEKSLRYNRDSLVTDVVLKNESLGVELHCHDAVDFNMNVYVKEIQVINLKNKKRDLRLFFTHDFHLYGTDIGDTVYFDPRVSSLIHYKAHRYFLMNCWVNGKSGVDLFACGDKEVPGREGTWKDAEDGDLSGSTVGWGSVDSTIGMKLSIPSRGQSTAYYWIAAGTNFREVQELNRKVQEIHPSQVVVRTNRYWRSWVSKDYQSFADLPESVTNLYKRSLLILRTQIDNQGAIIAANDSDIVRFGGDTYSYMWGRDGAFVTVALARAGYSEVCRRFFEFCSSLVTDEGYLFQHYMPDGAVASNWHSWMEDGKSILPIQEDSSALLIWALWQHFECAKDIEFIKSLYHPLIQKVADFLVKYRDPKTHLPHPSYDLWEERRGVHSFTVAAVFAGLKAAANFAKTFQDDELESKYRTAAEEIKAALPRYLYHKGLKRYARSGKRTENGYELDETLDISLAGLVTLGVLDPHDPAVVRTLASLKDRLWVKTKVGGCARYELDKYQANFEPTKDVPGNPWFISTLWLAEYNIARASSQDELKETIPFLEWCASQALHSGVLAEQIHPQDASPLSVAPLTWSHSSFVWTVLQYVDKFNLLKSTKTKRA